MAYLRSYEISVSSGSNFDDSRQARYTRIARVEQRLLDLFHEERLAADLGQRLVEDLVALGLDDDQLHLPVGLRGQNCIADVIGLP